MAILLRQMKAKDGDIVRIPLTKDKCAYGQIFFDGQYMAFFDYCGDCTLSVQKIIKLKILFKGETDTTAIAGTSGRWPIIGHFPPSDEVLAPFTQWSGEKQFRRIQYINGATQTSESRSATKAECENIREKTSSYFCIIEDMLCDHFLGLPSQNKREDGHLNSAVMRYLHSTNPGYNPYVSGEYGTLCTEPAFDWIYGALAQIPKHKDRDGFLSLSASMQPLVKVLNHDYADSIIAQQGYALQAAAEIILLLCGKGRSGAESLADNWLFGSRYFKKQQKVEAKTLIPLAIQAIDLVMSNNSELRGLMADKQTDIYTQWQAGLSDLKQRLVTLMLEKDQPLKKKQENIYYVLGEFGSLSNDQAQDWLNNNLATSLGITAIKQVLDRENFGYIKVDEGREIIAASEVLLALHGKGRKGVKNAIPKWVGNARRKRLQNKAEAQELIPVAISKIESVLSEGSELFELMSEPDGIPDAEWLTGCEDLKNKLVSLSQP